MEIDFGKIVTNALSALVAAVFVGAAAIVWTAANSIDDRIQAANNDIVKQQAALKATQEIIGRNLTDIIADTEVIKRELKSMNKILADLEILKGKVSFDPAKPFILEEFLENKDISAFKKEEMDKISNEIDTRRIQIYEQKVKK